MTLNSRRNIPKDVSRSHVSLFRPSITPALESLRPHPDNLEPDGVNRFLTVS